MFWRFFLQIRQYLENMVILMKFNSLCEILILIVICANFQIHGVLNVVSWGILLPLGAIAARYLKVFKSADPAWFYIHVVCQCSAYIVGVSGWATGLKLGSDSPGIQYNPHRNIGITLFCLGTLQVHNWLILYIY